MVYSIGKIAGRGPRGKWFSISAISAGSSFSSAAAAFSTARSTRAVLGW